MSDIYHPEEKCSSPNPKDSFTTSNTSAAMKLPLRPRHRPKNSTLDENAALEEARDTVDDSDIQLSHRYIRDTEDDDTLSPLGISSPTDRRSRIGRVAHERTSSLDLLLSTRMDRNKFENRFLQRGQ